MSDIDRWLQRHDLGKFANAFAENEIKLDDLSELTDEDVKNLGLPIGPRRRLQKAIRELVQDGSPETKNEPSTPNPKAEADRRQLTVMFCDLVGSTALSETMDIEDYRELLGAYQTAATSAIRDHNGYIARYMGDGLLVYFGYPVAEETDPERAVRAGLAVVNAIIALDHPAPLKVRVGIATGPVVVGDIVGEGASEEAAVLGETPNLAARLQNAAAPNTVVLSLCVNLSLDTACPG